jgi:hypothetical protein
MAHLATLCITRPGKPDARHELEFGGRVYRLTKQEADQVHSLMWAGLPQPVRSIESSATIIDAEWANRVQEELIAAVLDKHPPSPDLPDVPLHKRGFGVLDDGNE